MDYSIVILSVCTYVERRAKTEIDPIVFEEAIGYSNSHIRRIFKSKMGVTLSRYILTRRLGYAAFDLVHTEKSLLDIAFDCGFKQYDTFTRAFKRETGLLPSEFRRLRARAGRRLVASGVYAPAILDNPSQAISQTKQREVFMKQNQNGGSILLGVPKVEYKREERTPFPSCLKACLNYMGQDISYAYLMAASGAAFRLRWSKKHWDGGNVDICYIYEDSFDAFRRSFEAAGREYRFLRREDSGKKGFIDFIRAEIDNGRPVLALGIIGPPEACIVTGYRDNGETLMGWNFFQHRKEFNSGTAFDDNGYFISTSWWENECTGLLMSIGEKQNAPVSDRSILQNALELVDRKPITWEGSSNEVACGQEAYKTWAEWTLDDRQFGANITLPLLYERFMCQGDAQTMVGEGRYYAAEYIKSVAERHPDTDVLCGEAAGYFLKASEAASKKMNDLIGGFAQGEAKVRQYAEREVRIQIADLIREAAWNEAEAMERVRRIKEILPNDITLE